MAEGFAPHAVGWLGSRIRCLPVNGRISVPEHKSRSRRPSRALIAFCTAAVTATAGVAFVQVGHADPDLTLEEAQEKVEELNHKAEQAAERYHLAGEKLDAVERRLERADGSIAKQTKKVNEALAGMAGYAAASYQTGGIDPTVRTLLADDPIGYLAHASVLDAYARQQAGQITAVAHETRELEQVKLSADEERSRLTAIQEEREAEKAKVEELLGESEEILDNLEEEERQRLEEERRERERQQEREREEASDDPSRGDGGEDEDEERPEVPPNEQAQVVVDFALAQVGDPYVWAGNGPDAWDCSGLTSAAWAQVGVALPRSSASQIGVGTRVSHSQLQPGDLVFYYSPISHVGIYIGNGQIVHATHPGDVVSVDSVDLMPFAGASRPG